ncbi:25898_t:CDS:2 [Gigaspora margarita]|uniref:25898_t:CDS:1 n=1 Tax=Gigaspora margarita TaxID=4874 RepID=A0ABM8W1R3_GIGMA|nr:25898_t:CDS:2 [Gigaspora margarita]
MKYVATWSSEDRSVVGWNNIDNVQELKHECTILHNHVDYYKCPELFIHYYFDEYGFSKFFAVSDNKLVSMLIFRNNDERPKIGKILIHDYNLGSITKWDIKTLAFEAYFLFDPGYDVL